VCAVSIRAAVLDNLERKRSGVASGVGEFSDAVPHKGMKREERLDSAGQSYSVQRSPMYMFSRIGSVLEVTAETLISGLHRGCEYTPLLSAIGPSSTRDSGSTLPSRTISELAGTSKGTVSARAR